MTLSFTPPSLPAAPPAPIVTQTTSGHLAAVPSSQLDLRPHVGRQRAPTAAAGAGAQVLVAAAMASVGSLARQAEQRQRQRRQQGAAEGCDGSGGSGEEDEVQPALTSAATALEKALEGRGGELGKVLWHGRWRAALEHIRKRQRSCTIA